MKNKEIRLLVFISAIVLICDLITKFIIVKNVTDTIIVIPRVLELTNINNAGIAFGLNNGNLKNIFIIIIILMLIINFIKKQLEQIDKKTMVSLGLIIGGAVGNLLDRIFTGGVLDFIQIPGFPVFNLADISIAIGWILLVIYIIKYSFEYNKIKEEVEKD